MKLSELIQNLPLRCSGGDPTQTHVTDVVEDSRLVQAGHLFVARTGRSTDGRRHLADALQRGAAAVLTDQPLGAPQHIPVLLCDDVPAVAVKLARRFWAEPSSRLKLVGITGTNGKTTTAFMLRHLLRSAGKRCGLIGTIEIDDGRAVRPAALTTPGGVECVGLLGRMVAHGCTHAVMEVSSHALDQGRVDALQFAAAAFTNLSGDHLDYHGTMERYAASKAKLFESLPESGWAVVNADDPAMPRMLQDCRARRLRFGLRQRAVDCSAQILEASPRHTECRFFGPWGLMETFMPLVGRHNVANMLTALSLAHALDLEVGALLGAVADCPPVPGRLEPVVVDPPPPFDVLVDYAHTDDALANVLGALRPLTRGRLRVLFGCGGDRDPSKRPRMAAVACDLADDILITSDNPRTEDPQAIIDDVLKGVGRGARQRTDVQIDRRSAIEQILRTAEPGDVVLLAGKGHEDYQIIGTDRRSFDDRLEARRVLEAIAAGRS